MKLPVDHIKIASSYGLIHTYTRSSYELSGTAGGMTKNAQWCN